MQKKNLTRRSFIKTTGVAAVGISIFPGDIFSAEEKKLNFYNWDTYIGETTLDDFKDESGISVKMDLFADNGELFAKLRGGNPGYDIVVPTHDYVARFISAGLLRPLDLKKIPNAKNIASEWKNLSFDPGNKYSMPYFWGTVGLGYRKSKAKKIIPNDMKYVLDSDVFSGRIAWLSEGSSMFEIAMKYLGYDPENPTPEAIEKAEKLLTKQKKHVKVIAEDNGQDLLISGDVDVCVEWSGDISQVMEEDNDLGYTIPVNGAFRWCDNLCITKEAPHPENSHKFINYILDPKVGAVIAEEIGYSTPNQAALKLTSKEYRNDSARFPKASTLDRLFFPKYNGEEVSTLIQESWTRVLAS